MYPRSMPDNQSHSLSCCRLTLCNPSPSPSTRTQKLSPPHIKTFLLAETVRKMLRMLPTSRIFTSCYCTWMSWVSVVVDYAKGTNCQVQRVSAVVHCARHTSIMWELQLLYMYQERTKCILKNQLIMCFLRSRHCSRVLCCPSFALTMSNMPDQQLL